MIDFELAFFKGWGERHFVLSIRLLQRLAKEVEEQCDSLIEEFRSTGPVDSQTRSVINLDKGNDGLFKPVKEFGGLDSLDWNLDDVFLTYLPSLRRGATLVMICSFFEHQLNDLCRRIQVYLKLQKELSQSYGQGVVRAVKYLKDECAINIDNSQKDWAALRDILNLRNILVHAGGMTAKPEVADYVKKHSLLSSDSRGGVIIQSGYLGDVLRDINQYGQRIGRAIESRFMFHRVLVN